MVDRTNNNNNAPIVLTQIQSAQRQRFLLAEPWVMTIEHHAVDLLEQMNF
jgi:hypothetical protein